MKRDYYEILSVQKTASESEIKKSFRKLAQTCHPDKNQGDPKSEEAFKELNEASLIKLSKFPKFRNVN